ncbi:L-fuconolactonase [Jejuia pallidilutea]|uniref:L-fuconolactonase n=1 Tax=Jejuia pallidilutea TaxID=504487 RepID=A0A362X3M2_9FLAO|nr:amidohydrolase family protein [Jejuia pallidilutea]PQV51495.1 L-fuconolactonase [Jejuia pallidilutea]
MTIDSHQHFWKYDAKTYPWIDGTKEILKKDFLPDNLKPVLKKNDIDGCIAVQASHSIHETEFLLYLAENYDFIKGVVGWLDLRSETIEDDLKNLSKNPHLKGIRHIVQAEAKDFMLCPDFQFGISKLHQFGLTYDILIDHTQLEEAIQMVEQFPEQKFVLDHIAKPEISKGIDEKWRTNIENLAKNPNVYCKISGMVTETKNNDWKHANFNPFIETVVSAFGYDRIMYGSDWPVSLLACSYKEQFTILENYSSNFSAENRAKLMGLNAVKFYNL